MRNGDYDPRYLGYFDCFNQQRFFEAHDVLEVLWLPQREGADGAFYKGLIQVAGAFVHWKKNRPGPALALLDLARRNLEKYSPVHKGLDVSQVLGLLGEWRRQLAVVGPAACPALPSPPPRLQVEPAG